ncbi:MAG: FhaA domain-containing protein [Actinomycetota bacterium]|nr:DUF3662 domain-containing protein [Actinomycetota bacterium]
MGVARDLERRLEGLLEGMFAKMFRSGLQPIEVGRRIVREMEENRTVSVNNRTFAPNEFRILLGAEDYARFEPMGPGLEREFSELVIEAAKERRWNLMGMPRISFHEHERLGRGEFRTEAMLTADPGSAPKAPSTHEPSKEDPSATRAIQMNTAERLGIRSGGATLVVLGEKGDTKDKISITNPPVTIGRLSANDVVLSDPNVSRRHAELRLAGGAWTIADLGSTNGTLINGKLTQEQPLGHGDLLGFGSSELRFELSED